MAMGDNNGGTVPNERRSWFDNARILYVFRLLFHELGKYVNKISFGDGAAPCGVFAPGGALKRP